MSAKVKATGTRLWMGFGQKQKRLSLLRDQLEIPDDVLKGRITVPKMGLGHYRGILKDVGKMLKIKRF